MAVGSCTFRTEGYGSKHWDKTRTGQVLPNALKDANRFLYRSAHSVIVANQDECQIGSWVLFSGQLPAAMTSTHASIGRVTEILQVAGRAREQQRLADYITLQLAQTLGTPLQHGFPRLKPGFASILTTPKVTVAIFVSCRANILIFSLI